MSQSTVESMPDLAPEFEAAAYEAAETSAEPTTKQPPEIDTAARRRRSILVPLIIGIALFMQMLDSTIIANALPTISRGFHVSPIALNLAITAYLLAAAIFLPISGWAADRFGARSVFTAAIIGFAASSLFCGAANSLPTLVLARFVQGCAGALMVPVGRLVLLKTVPKSDLVDAMSWLTVPAILGPILGPPLGGFIVTYGSWRLIFYLNIPIAILGVIMVRLFVPNVREESHAPLDLRGFLLAGFGLAGLVFGFENLGRSLLPFWLAATLLLIGALCVSLFTLHAKRTEHPILHLPLFKIRTFLTSTVGGMFPRLAMGANSFLMALLLQIGFGMTAFEAGTTTFTGAIGALVMKSTAPRIIRTFGFKRVLMFNTLVTTTIFMSYSQFSADTPRLVIMGILLVGGFFNSLNFTALNALGYSDVSQTLMSRASTMSSMMQQLSISIGVGLSAVVVELLQRSGGTELLTPAQISPAFIIVGAFAPISLLFYFCLAHNAGEEVSGHGRPRLGRAA